VNVQGDLTRLRKQFRQLEKQSSFTFIDLKQYALQRGAIERKESGSLDKLTSKILGLFLPKNQEERVHNDWEAKDLATDLRNYAARDVYAGKLLFQHLSKLKPVERVSPETPPGTKVALVIQDGGEVIAYGSIASTRPTQLDGVRLSKNRVVINVEVMVVPSAAAMLYFRPARENLDTRQRGKTKAGQLTLEQVFLAAGSKYPFKMICQTCSLIFQVYFLLVEESI
jgi:hypothetical protein